jgi:hypothetical protein
MRPVANHFLATAICCAAGYQRHTSVLFCLSGNKNASADASTPESSMVLSYHWFNVQVLPRAGLCCGPGRAVQQPDSAQWPLPAGPYRCRSAAGGPGGYAGGGGRHPRYWHAARRSNRWVALRTTVDLNYTHECSKRRACCINRLSPNPTLSSCTELQKISTHATSHAAATRCQQTVTATP